MKRIIPAAAIATLLGAAGAMAQAVIVYDPELGEEFATKREVVDVVKEHYADDSVAYANGNNLPPGIASEIKPGEPLPEGAETEEVDPALAEALPSSKEGTRWVEIGEHLVELGDDGRAVLVVYDVVR